MNLQPVPRATVCASLRLAVGLVTAGGHPHALGESQLIERLSDGTCSVVRTYSLRDKHVVRLSTDSAERDQDEAGGSPMPAIGSPAQSASSALQAPRHYSMHVPSPYMKTPRHGSSRSS